MPPAATGASRTLRAFRFGWHGDNGLGEALLAKILAGSKTASACPAYDPPEGEIGELLRLEDKDGRARGVVRVTAVELVLFRDLDEPASRALGFSLSDMRRLASYANSREIGQNEEVRVTRFELVSRA